jgi:prepilin peptidase CpaA
MPTSAHLIPVLGTLLAVGAASDVAMHRIPNALVVGIAATGLLGALLATGAVGVGGSTVAIVVAAVVIWPAWTRGWVGGGDLKLGAATAAWLGVERLPAYVVASAVVVGLVSIVCYAASAQAVRSQVRRHLALAARGGAFSAPIGSETGRVQVPAGVGFAIGALATIAMTGGL